MTTDQELQQAHRNSQFNRNNISAEVECGCFYCLRRYASEEITTWKNNGMTAICPYCGTDSVISSKFDPIDDAFLQQMHSRWFGQAKKLTASEWANSLKSDRWTL